MVIPQLIKDLTKAEGRSEFVIAVFCDIRVFSSFSTHHESPDTAMFIKRFYLQLLEKYFSNALFAKPTGDGMLLVFRYDEKNLLDVSKQVIESCLKCVKDFDKLFSNDLMINFETPKSLGFGITRGTACCLFSGKKILDYSGQILNLAARLTDLARPQGVVIDGKFLKNVIPQNLHLRFKSQNIYVRSIAEIDPIPVFYSFPETELPANCLTPISNFILKYSEKAFNVHQIKNFADNLVFQMPEELILPEKIILEIQYPSKIEGFIISQAYDNFRHEKTAMGHSLIIKLNVAKKMIKDLGLEDNVTLKFTAQYIPKNIKKKQLPFN